MRYLDARPSFKPKHYGGLTLGANGRLGWSDGRNRLGGKYEVDGDSLTIAEVMSTLVACDFEPEDVDYRRAIRFEVDGNL